MSGKKRDEDEQDIQMKWQRLVATSGGDVPRGSSATERLASERREQKKVDGRTLRKTGRTHQVNVRLKQETKDAIQRVAAAKNWLIGEVIEHAVALLESQLSAPTDGE